MKKNTLVTLTFLLTLTLNLTALTVSIKPISSERGDFDLSCAVKLNLELPVALDYVIGIQAGDIPDGEGNNIPKGIYLSQPSATFCRPYSADGLIFDLSSEPSYPQGFFFKKDADNNLIISIAYVDENTQYFTKDYVIQVTD